MFFIVLSQSLIKFLPPSPVDVHTICLISGTTLNCVLAFYTLEYLLLSLFLLVARRSCVNFTVSPQRLVVGHNNAYQSIQLFLIDMSGNQIRGRIHN